MLTMRSSFTIRHTHARQSFSMGNGSLTCDEAADRLTPGIVCIHHVRYPDNNVSVSPPVMQSHAVSCSVTTPLKWSPARLLCWPVPPVITDTFPASFDGHEPAAARGGETVMMVTDNLN